MILMCDGPVLHVAPCAHCVARSIGMEQKIGGICADFGKSKRHIVKWQKQTSEQARSRYRLEYT